MPLIKRLITALTASLLLTPSIVFASILPGDQPAEKFKPVNDMAQVMTKEQQTTLTNDLNAISAQTVSNPPVFRFYLFTEKHDKIPNLKKELTNDSIPLTITPAAFIYDVDKKKFELLVDNRIDTLVSRNYVHALVNEKIADGLDAKELTEISVRLASIIQIADQNQVYRQQDIPMLPDKEIPKHGEIKAISFSSQQEQEQNQRTEPKEQKKPIQKTQSSDMSPILFLAVLVPVVVILYKKSTVRKKN